MPDISLGNHIFDLAFHPQSDHVYAGLVTGEIKAFAYHSTDGSCESTFTLRPSKRSCRGLATDMTGDRLWSVTKDKAMFAIDTKTGKVVDSKLSAHESPINRVVQLLPHMFATGDDDGVIKLWDPRKPDALREYKQHFDFISDFVWLEDKRQLVATSGDGTLSVMDVRSNKTEPLARSEDQEDELLSIVSIKGDTKCVVGTQLGILSIFNRNRGWGDCVDRIPGHPSSVDALCALTPDVILTGSSDGLIRAVQILPTKFLGVIADHGDFPIERLKLDRAGKWLGSASHDEVLKMTDVGDALEESEGEGEGPGGGKKSDVEADVNMGDGETEAGLGDMALSGRAAKLDVSTSTSGKREVDVDSDGSSDEPDSDETPKKKKKRRKKNKDSIGSRKKGGGGGVGAFFSGL